MDVFAAGLMALAVLTALCLVVGGLASRRELQRMAKQASAAAETMATRFEARLAASEAEAGRLRQRLAQLEDRIADEDRRVVEELSSLARIARLVG